MEVTANSARSLILAGSIAAVNLLESSAIIGRAPDASSACRKPGERSCIERGIGPVIRVEFDVVNATRRAKARLDSTGIALQQRVQADTFAAQQREVRAAVSGFPQPEWRQARSEADGPTRNGAHSAHGARGTDVHGASANHDRRDGAPVESRTGIRRRGPARGRHRCDARVRSEMRPCVTAIG